MDSFLVGFLVTVGVGLSVKWIFSLGRWTERRRQKKTQDGDIEEAERIVSMINGAATTGAEAGRALREHLRRDGSGALVSLVGGRFDGEEVLAPPERRSGSLRVTLQKELLVVAWIDSPAAEVADLPFPAADYHVDESGVGRLVD